MFTDLGKLLDGGDHRVIIVAGNHDADLLWPKVQLAIARAIKPRDPSRLIFTPGPSYEHRGVHVEHGHAFDAANRFSTGHAPFGRGRDSDGRCRLQASWGEVFVDQFYTDVERKVPFIDNLYPQSAAILWAMRDNPDPQRDAGAVIRFIDLLRVAEGGDFNRNAATSLLQSLLGTPGAHDRGPESAAEVVEHVANRLAKGDVTADGDHRCAAPFPLRSGAGQPVDRARPFVQGAAQRPGGGERAARDRSRRADPPAPAAVRRSVERRGGAAARR